MAAKGALDVLILLGADEIDTSKSKAFKIYVGTHGDAGAHTADLILPGAAYTEKNGLFVNTEGRVQRANRAVFPKGEAKEDWSIFRALSEILGHKLPYDSHEQLREKLFVDHPVLAGFDYAPGKADFDPTGVGAKGVLSDAPLKSPVVDYYMTNPIARASLTMAELSAVKSGASKMAAE